MSQALRKLPPQSSHSSHSFHTLVREVSKIVSEITGVQLGERQQVMVESRLKKRMTELSLQTPESYLDYLRMNSAGEVSVLVSLLTTHHTYFFREFSHFEYLEQKALADIVARLRREGRKTITVWSAACSRGHEVYSLSMLLSHALSRIAPDFNFEIFGTDVDPESVSFAKNGVYPWKEVKEIPHLYLGKHWVRGGGDISNFVKAKKSIKTQCSFDVVNLLDISNKLGNRSFDIIFCRNVFIYFTNERILKITEDLIKHLNPGGTLFIGISESLHGMNLAVTNVGPSIYVRKDKKAPLLTEAPKPTFSVESTPKHVPLKPLAPLRVLCVDDSASILNLLKQILKKEQGFEVVATAENGLVAAKKLKEHEVDVITLDIHMPEQNGLEFLGSLPSKHPPVVMISSVSRENAELALKCLEAGASDYVEKPALANLMERGEEIKTKLHCAVSSQIEMRSTSSVQSADLEKSFQRTLKIQKPERKLEIILATPGDRVKLTQLLKEQADASLPTVVFFEGAETILVELAKDIGSKTSLNITAVDKDVSAIQPGKVVFADFKRFDEIKAKHSERRISVSVMGEHSRHAVAKLGGLVDCQILVEDLGDRPSPAYKHLKTIASDLTPFTSFDYLSREFLSRE